MNHEKEINPLHYTTIVKIALLIFNKDSIA
jgi:hypothetical protein